MVQFIQHGFTAVLLAVAAAANSAAASYSDAIFFGDSLTDAGHNGASYTTNPGPVWAVALGRTLGHDTLEFTDGGHDYAVAGTGVGDISHQIDIYLATTDGLRADRNALYAVWAGSNDVFGALNQPVESRSTFLGNFAGDLVEQVARLQAAGARHVIVLNLPDSGSTPSYRDNTAITALVQDYNRQLFEGLAAQRLEVIPIDAFGFLRQLGVEHARFGIINTTDTACPGSAIDCNSSNLVAPNADQTYSFADGVHPTSGVHAMLADYIVGVLAAPHQIAQLPESAIAGRSALHDLLRGQLAAGTSNRQRVGHHFWIATQGDRDSRQSEGIKPGSSTDGYRFAIGNDFALGEQVVVGGALSVNRTDADFSDHRGGYIQRDAALSAYGSWRDTQWFTRGAIVYGMLDFDVDRRIPVGIDAFTASGSTSGRDLSLQVETGYEFTSGNFRHGPVLGLTAQELHIDGFDEGTGAAIDLGYGKQRRHALAASAAWQLEYQGPHYAPYARLGIERDLKSNEHEIEVSQPSIPEALPYDVDVSGAGRMRYAAELGLKGEISKVLAFNLGAMYAAGPDREPYKQISAGLSFAY